MVGCRYDSSLGQLTKKFIALINKASDGILDLNHAAEMLQVRVHPVPPSMARVQPWKPNQWKARLIAASIMSG
jgi:hypothetical protein